MSKIQAQKPTRPSTRAPALSAALALILVAPPSVADTVKQVSVIVNQLANAPLPNVRDRQKAMNAILKQCDQYGYQLRFTITETKLNQNPQKNGQPVASGGNALASDVTNLIEIAQQQEIKDGGLKVWVANSIANSSGSSVNGIAEEHSGVCTIAMQSGIDGDEHTWAHELGHALGLPHSGDENNLMYESRRKADDTTPSGNGLTKAQCDKLSGGFHLRGATSNKTAAQKAEPKPKVDSSTVPDDQDADPVSLDPATDISWGTISVDDDLTQIGQSTLSVMMKMNAEPPAYPSPVQTLVLLDLDDDPGTGDPGGFDAVLELIPFTSSSGDLAVIELPSQQLHGIEPLSVLPVSVASTGATGGDAQPAGLLLAGQVPIAVLDGIVPLAPQVRFVFLADDGGMFDDTPPALVDIQIVDLNLVSVSPIVVSGPGEGYDVAGSLFEPLEPYIVLFDDDLVASGTTDAVGSLFESLIVPVVPDGDYVIDVISDPGSAGIDSLQVGSPSVPTLALPALGVLVAAIGVLATALVRRQRVRGHPTRR